MSLGMKEPPKGYKVYERKPLVWAVTDPSGSVVGNYVEEEAVEAAWYHLRDNIHIDDFAAAMMRVDAIMSEGIEPIARAVQGLKSKLDTAELNTKALSADLDEQNLKLLNERAKVDGLERALTEAHKYGNEMFKQEIILKRKPMRPPWKDEEADEG